MSEVLSQNEIDQLLNALNTGELDVDEVSSSSQEKQIKEYDFARPSKFAKEHLRTLEIIYEHYARLISTALPAYLRSPCQIDVINSEAISYSEFANSMSNPIILGIIDFYPLKGNILIDVGISIGYAIVDRLLGGQGNVILNKRELSEIEVSIIEKVMNVFVEQMVEPWKNVCEIDPLIDHIETNSQFAQVISPSEIVALITLNLRIGNVEGLINVCIPYITIESIIDKLNTKFWYSTLSSADDEEYEQYIERQIEHSKIPIKTVLGKAKMNVSDFVYLQQGDIIKLDTKINEEIDVFVGNIKKFKAKVGMFDKHNAAQVTKIIRREED